MLKIIVFTVLILIIVTLAAFSGHCGFELIEKPSFWLLGGYFFGLGFGLFLFK